MEDMHKYEIIGYQYTGSIKVPVRTIVIAGSQQQARCTVNRDNISVKKINDLGTLLEQNILQIQQRFGIPKKE